VRILPEPIARQQPQRRHGFDEVLKQCRLRRTVKTVVID
jgi:hypothetical protein